MAHSDPIIAILGPTASGKSEVAQKVALKLKGEVVSADSMQIYRYMNIGTAKLSPAERIVPHHLIDILDPGEPFSAQLFQQLSRKAFEDIRNRNNVAILCGGTGLYVQAALEDMRFSKRRANSQSRKRKIRTSCSRARKPSSLECSLRT